MKYSLILLIGLFIVSCGTLRPNYPNPETQDEFIEKSFGTNKIIIRTGGACHFTPGKEEAIFETTDSRKIAGLIDNIIFLPREKGKENCACCGERTIEFYKDGSIILAISSISKTYLRCKELAHGTETPADVKTFAYLEVLMKEGRQKQLDDFMNEMKSKPKSDKK